MINVRDQTVGMIGEFFQLVTAPALNPIRKLVPNLGNVDISPVILFFIIMFLRYIIALYILPHAY